LLQFSREAKAKAQHITKRATIKHINEIDNQSSYSKQNSQKLFDGNGSIFTNTNAKLVSEFHKNLPVYKQVDEFLQR